jgi:ABC-type multidrug transport system ATPase subunit
VLTTFGASFAIIAAISGVIISIGCFTHSSPGIVAILFILFALASLAFTLAISSLFRNSRVAALAGPLIFFLTAQFYNVFLERGELQEGMNGAKALTSLFPAMGFYLAASLMAKYEGTQVGITAKNFATAGGGFSVANSIAILFFDIWLWLFIAWYFDQVLPSDYGLQQRPWFLCSPSYWFGKKNEPLALRALIADDANRPLAVEPMDEPMGARGVVVQGLRKVWPPRRVAVESLDMEMRSGQITSLLGANGAGKTTTISMLTGLMPPTSGNATVDGLSITSHMTTIRYSLGVCPQQNVLFDQLTPVQHLSLYGAIKGLEGAALQEAIDLLISKVMLSERKDVQARRLSGGQKRKLCLAISLIGGAKTIFLDEPTSGMDPHSRRSIWALLREQREGRTIVLTTHFLDEAEILSDRIAIMAEGKLKCVGSPLFLKEHLGTGYALTITKTMAAASAKFDKEMLLTFVKKHVPLATLQSETKREASVRLPGDKLSMFQSLFEELDKNFRQLGIDDYGATCTTLEDVFLKINENALQRLEDQKESHNDANLQKAHNDARLEIPPPKGELMKGAKSSPDSRAAPQVLAPMSQTGATMHVYSGLVAKRRIAARRDCYTTCCMICFPVSLVIGALALLGVAGRITAIPDPVALLPDPLFPNGFGGRIPRPVPLTMPKGNLAEILLPQLAEGGWTGFQYRANSTPNEFMQVTREMEAYVLANPSVLRPAAMAWSPGVRIPPFCLGIGPGPCPATSNSSVSVVTLMHNATNFHSMPILINTLYDALLLQATGGASTITGFTQDLPLDDASKAFIDSFLAVFAAILIMVPYSFVGATFVTPLIREKESGSKEMQFICGVGTVTYWFATWTWDLCMYLIIELASFIVFFIFNRKEFIGTPEAFWGTILILLGFGWSVIGLSSMVSFYFKTPSNGLIVMIAFHFLTGFGMVVADFILENIESTKLIIVGLRHFFRIFPAYCLGQGFVTLATRKSASAVSAFIPGLPSDPTPGLYE